MRSNRIDVVLVIVAAVTSGCGYGRGGSWDDVPENWHRVSVHVRRGLRQSRSKRYEIWAYTDDPTSNSRVLIDRDTGNIFLADYQV